MEAPASQPRCYLVEWYRPALAAELVDGVVATLDRSTASRCTKASPVRLLMALAVPDDELVFGVFAAGSEQEVAELCDQAGFPAQRLSQAIDAPVERQV